jgi:hypothetical protein
MKVGLSCVCLFTLPCRAPHRELAFEPDGTISGLISLEGEKISFVEPVNPAATGVRALGYACTIYFFIWCVQCQLHAVPAACSASCMQHAL